MHSDISVKSPILKNAAISRPQTSITVNITERNDGQIIYHCQ